MLPEVMEVVGGRAFAGCAARLEGYARWLVRGEVFPAVVPDAGAVTPGVLWEGLDLAALARIDRFEGDLYERVERRVALAEGAEREAFVYVLRPEQRALLTDASFDEAAFRARHLAAYLVACRAFAREGP